MFKTTFQIILIGLCIAGYFFLIKPAYDQVQSLKAQQASFQQAIDNSDKLKTLYNDLSTKYRSFTPDNLDKLNTLLPDNVDNIKLVLEIEKITSKHNLNSPQDVKFDADQPATTAAGASTPAATVAAAAAGTTGTAAPKKNYNTFGLEFYTTGTYANFLDFLKEMESSLRIVDIDSITVTTLANQKNPNIFRFNLKIKTYWLKN